MKQKNWLLLAFIFLVVFTSNCGNTKEKMSEQGLRVPNAEFNNTIQLYLPDYYNKETGCYVILNDKDNFEVTDDFEKVNYFSRNEGAKIGFIVTLKPWKRFVFSGEDGLVLFRFNKTTEKWVKVPYSSDSSSPLWEQGTVLEMGFYINGAKQKCNYLPEKAIFISPLIDSSQIPGRYRLYIWGLELERNSIMPAQLIGDYFEFTISP